MTAIPPHDDWRAWLRARLDRGSELGLRLTVSLALFCAALWAFSGILDSVLEDDSLVRWDRVINEWFHGHATPGGLRAFAVITQLGQPGVAVTVALVALWLLWRRERVLLWGWLVGNAGGWVIDVVLKTTVHRDRPQYAAAYLHGHSYSFPSGHTMASMVCFPALAIVVATVLGWHGARRAALYVAAFSVVASIAFSRVYLGVHYPSDVLGGAAAGFAWLVLCRMVVRWLRHRRHDPLAKIPTPASMKG
jgi:undecaprenyl-diphosphatase